MSLKNYIRILREQRLLLAATVVLALGASVLLFYLVPAQYSASTTLYVSAQTDSSTSSTYEGSLLSQERVKSYAELATNERVAADVIAALGLQTDVSTVARQLSASSPLGSVLITLTATDESPVQAAAITNAAAMSFSRLVDDLERPTRPGAQQAVVIRQVEPAAVPTTPSSAGLRQFAAAGIVVGLILGLGAALARSSLDDTIKDPEQIERLTSAPNLGVVPVSSIGSGARALHDPTSAPWQESMRHLRTNVQFIDVDHPSKVVVVTSALPGEGKTTVTVGLASAQAASGSRVLVVDCDLRNPNCARSLELEESVGLTSILTNRAHHRDVLQRASAGRFDVIATGLPLPPNPAELLASRQMQSFLEAISKEYDLVLLDSAPLLPVSDTIGLAPCVDGTLLLSRYRKTREKQLDIAAKSLAQVSARILGTVMTLSPASTERPYGHYGDHGRSVVGDGPSQDEREARYATNTVHHPEMRPTNRFRQ